MPSVTVEVDPYEVLEEISDKALAEEVERRRSKGAGGLGDGEHYVILALRSLAQGDIESAVVELTRSLPRNLQFAPEVNAAYAASSRRH